MAFDIVAQSFHETPKEHAPAVCFAIFPSIAQLLRITLDKANPVLLRSALEPDAGTLYPSAMTDTSRSESPSLRCSMPSL